MGQGNFSNDKGDTGFDQIAGDKGNETDLENFHEVHGFAVEDVKHIGHIGKADEIAGGCGDQRCYEQTESAPPFKASINTK